MDNLQAIFQVKFDRDGEDGKWLDYVRHSVRNEESARQMAVQIKEETNRKIRFSIENWTSSKPTIFIGDWDKSQLSPAAQYTGIFKAL